MGKTSNIKISYFLDNADLNLQNTTPKPERINEQKSDLIIEDLTSIYKITSKKPPTKAEKTQVLKNTDCIFKIDSFVISIDKIDKWQHKKSKNTLSTFNFQLYFPPAIFPKQKDFSKETFQPNEENTNYITMTPSYPIVDNNNNYSNNDYGIDCNFYSANNGSNVNNTDKINIDNGFNNHMNFVNTSRNDMNNNYNHIENINNYESIPNVNTNTNTNNYNNNKCFCENCNNTLSNTISSNFTQPIIQIPMPIVMTNNNNFTQIIQIGSDNQTKSINNYINVNYSPVILNNYIQERCLCPFCNSNSFYNCININSNQLINNTENENMSRILNMNMNMNMPSYNYNENYKNKILNNNFLGQFDYFNTENSESYLNYINRKLFFTNFFLTISNQNLKQLCLDSNSFNHVANEVLKELSLLNDSETGNIALMLLNKINYFLSFIFYYEHTSAFYLNLLNYSKQYVSTLLDFYEFSSIFSTLCYDDTSNKFIFALLEQAKDNKLLQNKFKDLFEINLPLLAINDNSVKLLNYVLTHYDYYFTSLIITYSIENFNTLSKFAEKKENLLKCIFSYLKINNDTAFMFKITQRKFLDLGINIIEDKKLNAYNQYTILDMLDIWGTTYCYDLIEKLTSIADFYLTSLIGNNIIRRILINFYSSDFVNSFCYLLLLKITDYDVICKDLIATNILEAALTILNIDNIRSILCYLESSQFKSGLKISRSTLAILKSYLNQSCLINTKQKEERFKFLISQLK